MRATPSSMRRALDPRPAGPHGDGGEGGHGGHGSARWAGRTVALALACAALLLWAAFAGATTGATATAEVGMAAVVVLLVGVVTLGRPRLGRAGRATVAALASLAAWTAASIGWSVAGDRSWDTANLVLASLAFLALGALLAAAGRERAARLATAVLALVAGLVLGWALLGVAIPSLFPDGDRTARLREPFGHAPPLALVAGIALPLAGGLLRGALPGRIVATLLAYSGTIVLLLTQSRAGLLAVAVVLVLWAVLAGEPVLRLLRLLPAVAPGLVVALVAFTRPALVEDGSARSARVDAGIVFAVVAVVGLVVAVALELRLPVDRLVRSRPRAARTTVAAIAVVLVAGVVAALAAGGFSEGECANDPSRLVGACANNRLDWWGEAWDVFRAHPGIGTGAGTFVVARTGVREAATETTQPHSVPLQVMADLGIVGLGLALLAAVALATALRAALRRLDGPERQAAAALVALPVAFAVHSVFDYSADFLALTGPVLLACGVLLGAGRPVVRGARVVAWPVTAGLCLAVAASLLLPYLSDRAVDDAYEASASGRGDDAADEARRARDLDPLSLRARYAQADVAGDDAAALAALEGATRLQPDNADTWYQLGLYRYSFAAEPDACAAYFALNRAYTLDPVSRRWTPGGVLDRARDEVNAGACER